MSSVPAIFALEPRYKEQFVLFLGQGFSAFVAAMKIWPNDAGIASQVAEQWPHDPYVRALIEKAKDAEAIKVVRVTKDVQIKRIEERLDRMDNDSYLKAERLIADMAGHIERPTVPTVTVNNNSQTFERVMVFKDHGDDDQWESKAAKQQSNLIEGNR